MKQKIILMGVSGSGKSTIGTDLARTLGYRFIDGDDLHSSANRRKMSQGIPLDDMDRKPWLEETACRLRDAPGGIIIACSALKRVYRDQIRSIEPKAYFIHLVGQPALLEARLRSRPNHFFKDRMLASQLEILEELAPDEQGMRLDVASTPDEIIRAAVAEITDAP